MMTIEESAKELGRLHAESLEAWETRTVKACEERGWGTLPGPEDKQRAIPGGTQAAPPVIVPKR
jgi:hypothetical protein